MEYSSICEKEVKCINRFMKPLTSPIHFHTAMIVRTHVAVFIGHEMIGSGRSVQWFIPFNSSFALSIVITSSSFFEWLFYKELSLIESLNKKHPIMPMKIIIKNQHTL